MGERKDEKHNRLIAVVAFFRVSCHKHHVLSISHSKAKKGNVDYSFHLVAATLYK